MRTDKYEQRKKITNIIITVVVAVVMVASILGYALINNSSSDNSINYGQYSFSILQNGDYKTKFNGKYYEFHYFPSDLERINLSNDIVDKLKAAKGIAYVFDPNESIDNLGYSDSARFELQSQLSVPIVFGITQQSATYMLPVLSCDNATQGVPFIILNISSDSTFAVDNNNPDCIIMNAKLKDILALKERLVYGLLGIMTN